jgi:hypothetical protein
LERRVLRLNPHTNQNHFGRLAAIGLSGRCQVPNAYAGQRGA